jgi:hypothetical protein
MGSPQVLGGSDGENIYLMEKTSTWWRKHLPDGENIYLMEKRSTWWRKHLPDGENIYLMEKRSTWWRKHLSDGENIYLMEKRSTWWRKPIIALWSNLEGPSWSWSYGSWIYTYLYNQYLSALKLWVQILLMARWTCYNIMWYSLSVTYGMIYIICISLKFIFLLIIPFAIMQIVPILTIISVTKLQSFFLLNNRNIVDFFSTTTN